MPVVPGGKQDRYSLPHRQLHDFVPKKVHTFSLALLVYRIDIAGRQLGRFHIFKLNLIAIWTNGDSQNPGDEAHEILQEDGRFCTSEDRP